MGLTELFEKSKKVHTVEVHGERIDFCELTLDEETQAMDAGRVYAEKLKCGASKEDYALAFKHYEMIKKAGDPASIKDFLALGENYLVEISMVMTEYLNHEVHTEVARVQERIEERKEAARKLKLEKMKTAEL